MAALEVLALNTVIPQIQAPQVGDTYLFPRVAEFSAGTALLPSLAATGDLDTGMWFPAANTLAWSTGGSERMRITSAGEVGIGTSTPGAILGVQRSDSSTTIGGSTSVIKLNNGSGTLNSTSGLEFFHTNDLTVNTGRLAGVYGLYESFNGSGLGGALVFATNTAGDATIDERVRIKSAGQVRFVPLAADPTVNVEDGDVYYNSGTNKLRLRAAGAWVDLN